MQSFARLSPACDSVCGPAAMASVQLMQQLVPWNQHTQFQITQLVLTADAAGSLQKERNCWIFLAQQQHNRAASQPCHLGQSAVLSKQIQHYQQLQLRHGFASLPCRLTEDSDSSKEYATAASGTAAASTGSNRGLASTGSSSCSRSSNGGDDDGVDEDMPNHRRRSTSESRAALRRTTESRAAVEDVAVMSKSQLLRRKKAWLAEQCWERQLPHAGLKDDLVQRLLDWQTSDQGQEAAAHVVAAAQAAMAAIAASSRREMAGLQVDKAFANPSKSETVTVGIPHELGTATNQQMGVVGAGCGDSTAPSRRRRKSAATAAVLDNNNSSNSDSIDSINGINSSNNDSIGGIDSSNNLEQGLHEEAAVHGPATSVLQQPPRNAAAAAAETVTILLHQLQEQADNAIVVGLARNALETYVQSLEASGYSSTSEGLSWASPAAGTAAQVVQEVATVLTTNSSPQSLAALAKACYSREVQIPLLAAAVAEAVAAVASQLGPQEVYGVLRLLVEHLGAAGQEASSNQDSAGSTAMMKGFRALAEGMIRYSTALHPRHLTEAVQLLANHNYDDPYGLWMIAKEATERLSELAPEDVVILLDAIAGMHIADDALCENVAVVVGSGKDSYSQQQLQDVEAAMRRMGCSTTLYSNSSC